MENIIYKFDEVLTDGYSCLLLGDVYSLQSFQNKSQLGDNLQNAFTTTKAGDDVVKYGDMIYLGNVQNPYDDGYTIFFNFGVSSHVKNLPNSNIIHNVVGNLLHITSNSLCVYSWRYLQTFNQIMIDQLYNLSESNGKIEEINGVLVNESNTVRQRINIPNGYYQVDVLCGYLEGNIPFFEFIIKPTSQTSIEKNLNYLTSYDFSLPNI